MTRASNRAVVGRGRNDERAKSETPPERERAVDGDGWSPTPGREGARGAEKQVSFGAVEASPLGARERVRGDEPGPVSGEGRNGGDDRALRAPCIRREAARSEVAKAPRNECRDRLRRRRENQHVRVGGYLLDRARAVDHAAPPGDLQSRAAPVRGQDSIERMSAARREGDRASDEAEAHDPERLRCTTSDQPPPFGEGIRACDFGRDRRGGALCRRKPASPE